MSKDNVTPEAARAILHTNDNVPPTAGEIAEARRVLRWFESFYMAEAADCADYPDVSAAMHKDAAAITHALNALPSPQ